MALYRLTSGVHTFKDKKTGRIIQKVAGDEFESDSQLENLNYGTDRFINLTSNPSSQVGKDQQIEDEWTRESLSAMTKDELLILADQFEISPEGGTNKEHYVSALLEFAETGEE